MRKLSILILTVLASLSAAALVPPRDPARWNEWREQVTARQAIGMHRAPMATQAIGQRTIIPKVLVIMANFADYQFVSSRADVDSMFNGYNWTKDDAKGSVRQYFYDQSNGAYNPQFDIVGPITLSNGYAYYGAGSSAGPMVDEACKIVNDSVDFSQYDLNGDNKIDLVYVFYAGFGENDPPSDDLIPDATKLVWPQYTTYSGGTYDGKRLDACVYSNELDGLASTATNHVVTGIGTMCHEFGHALGLPDLYQTTGSQPTRCGIWDVMDWGMYDDYMHSPPAYSAYERFFMGWLTPTLIVAPDTLTLAHIATSNEAFMITTTDEANMNGVSPSPSDFYLLENRQLTSWDRGLPGSGMMITHIRYNASKWTSNTVNNSPPLGVDIVIADGNKDSEWIGKASDLFPAGASAYEQIADHAITDITMTDGIVRFVYRGGIEPEDPTAVTTQVNDRQVYKTIRDGQLLIHSNGHTYSVYGIRQDY